MKIIEVKDVSLGYNDKTVVEGLSFDVEERDFWTIVGPNGTGKTTLIKAILGLIKPLKGKILVFGCPVQRVCKHRKMIGYVPQMEKFDPNFPARVMDVVLTGSYSKLGAFKMPGRKERGRALELLRWLGMEELADHPIGKLSGGQQRKALLARALFAEPRALILDEPTSGVDIVSQEKLIELIEKVYREKGLPVLFVTHNVNPILHMITHAVLLGFGRHAAGSREIFFDKKVLREIYGKEIEIVSQEGRKYIITGDYHHA
ncbi:MAG: metal ABC transporter ATP-binding protein [Candidatus Hydrothermota bacterium]|nr:MAG: metal ABC transporter ATP-binding protein [Candidatus Hydrothermae bacterium]